MAYKDFLREQMKTDKIKQLPQSKRFKTISALWKEQKGGAKREPGIGLAGRIVKEVASAAAVPLKELQKNVSNIPGVKAATEIASTALDVDPRAEGKGFPGEKHGVVLQPGSKFGTRYSYLGANTKVTERVARGDKGINDLDKCAKTHDMKYEKIKGDLVRKRISEQEMLEEVRDADNAFIDCIRSSTDDKISRELVLKLMSAKKAAENARIINPKRYLLTGGFI